VRLVIEERLAELGIVLPPVMPPAGNYIRCVIDGTTLYTSGHGPQDGEAMVRGKVGSDLTIEQGRHAARLTGLSILASMQAALGTLDRVERLLKVLGMVNVAPGFDRTPEVINGCSDLFVDIFGDAGRHARSAVGMAELPGGIAVEIELIARLK